MIVSPYTTAVSLDQAKQTILRDPYLTQGQKKDILQVLVGGGTGSPYGALSTGDIVRGAVGAGIGGITSRYLGTVLGGAFSLSPRTLDKVQDVGILAGMLRGSGIWR